MPKDRDSLIAQEQAALVSIGQLTYILQGIRGRICEIDTGIKPGDRITWNRLGDTAPIATGVVKYTEHAGDDKWNLWVQVERKDGSLGRTLRVPYWRKFSRVSP